MRLRQPFGWLPPAVLPAVFVGALAVTLAVMVALNLLGGPLKTEASPAGIISFELAGETAQSQAMMDAWGPRGSMLALLNLGLDHLFLVAYPVAIALGCVLVAQGLGGNGRLPIRLGLVLAWAQIAAGALDAVENLALIRLVLGSTAGWEAGLAKWCAIPKFALVAAGLLYVLVGALAVGVIRSQRFARLFERG